MKIIKLGFVLVIFFLSFTIYAQYKMLSKQKNETHIFINQVGFKPNHPKFFVVTNPASDSFEVIRFIPWGTVFKGRLIRISGDLDTAWVGDFSSVDKEGTYILKYGKQQYPYPVIVSNDIYRQPLQTLYYYYPPQRCGNSTTGWHAPCHLQDGRCAQTGELIDLTGGWHQSGDLRKWMSTGYGLLGLSQLGLVGKPRWDEGNIAEELKWGNTYFHKMIKPNGAVMDYIIESTWGERKAYTNDTWQLYSFLQIMGQALTADYFKGKDDIYSKLCFDKAVNIWNYMMSPAYPKTPYSPPEIPKYHEWMPKFYSFNFTGSSYFAGDALYSAVALFKASNDKKWLDAAAIQANQLLKMQMQGSVNDNPLAGWFYVDTTKKELAAHCNDGQFGEIGLCDLYSFYQTHKDAKKWRMAIELAADQRCQMAKRNPWGLLPCYYYSKDPGGGKPVGNGFYRYFYNVFSFGVNLDIAKSAVFLYKAYKITGKTEYLQTAQRQIDWILGCNPYAASTIEGVGRNQPERFINPIEFFPPVPQIAGAVMTGIGGYKNNDVISITEGTCTEYDMPANALLLWLFSEMNND